MALHYDIRKTPGDTAWFRHDRFGMFIHWGLYSMPARHEWVKNHEEMTTEEYEKYFRHFDPDLYDPKAWARSAKNAGMKYVVLTTKHHEGFCLFDTKYTDYKSTNTPCGKDLVREYVDAFRAEGLKVGFYYSLLDWHHPDYTIDCCHPQRNAENIEELDAGKDLHRYAQYMRDQVTELLTNYGKIDILWFDFSLHGKGKDEWEAEELIATARKLQPWIIIDNRTQIEQDLWTPEQVQPTEWVRDSEGRLVTWELCQTFSGSWGYHRDEQTWLSPEMLVRMLVNTVSCGGNLLLNVGPTSRGYIDKRAENALAAMGEWMKYNARSIYGCTMSEFTAPDGIRFTQTEEGDRLYVHLMTYPYGRFLLPGLQGKIDYAQFLHDDSEVRFEEKENGVEIHIPRVKPDSLVPVIELFLK